MNETVLAELRDLALERGYESPFSEQVEFEKWADKVAPRLAFEPKLARRFANAVSSARSHQALGLNPLGSINDAIGLLNQAILVLETQVRSTHAPTTPVPAPLAPPSLELPSKITLKWLYAHAPLSLYSWLLGLLVAAFLAGVAATETPLYQALRPKAADPKPSPALASPSVQPPPSGASAAK